MTRQYYLSITCPSGNILPSGEYQGQPLLWDGNSWDVGLSSFVWKGNFFVQDGNGNNSLVYNDSTDDWILYDNMTLDGSIILAGNTYSAPTLDLELVPKKYVDDEIADVYKTNIVHIADGDFISNTYTVPSTLIGSNTLLEIELTGTTDVTVVVPNAVAANDGLGISILYKSGTVDLTVEDVDGNVVQVFNHSDDAISIVSDGLVDGEWYVRQSTVADTSSIDVTSWNDVTDITTLEDLMSHMGSSSETTPGIITKVGDGSITVSTSEWSLRDGDDDDSTLRPITIPATASPLFPTDRATSYLTVSYNAGNPLYAIATDITTIKCRSLCVKAILYRRGNQVDVLNIGNIAVDFPALYARREAATNYLAYGEGLATSASGLEFSVTAGTVYAGIVIKSIPALSSSVDNFTYYYRDGSGGWSTQTAQTAINNTLWDNGTGTLATLLNSQKYAVHWVYVSINEPTRLVVVYGQEEYSDLASATAAGLPTVLPPFAQKYSTGKLVAKLIIKRGAATPEVIQSPFSTVFTTSTPTTHNGLSGLQGGSAGEYYHLTQAQYDAVQSGVSGSFTTTDGKTVTVTSGIITSIV